jgi:L-alanine-DL-glutamate epimerase-like enolase superfamily enzyme
MHELKIERIAANHCNIPAEMHFSYGSKTMQAFGVCRVYAGGLVGHGERQGGLGEEDETVARSFIGKDACGLDGLLLEGGGVYKPEAHGQPEMFSMALYDLVGKAHGLPMHMLLGGARRKRVPLMPCIFAKSPEQAAEIAQGFLAQGFRALKVKLYGEVEGDCAIVRAIREIMPDGFLQGDANLGYEGIDAGREAMRRLGEAGLTVAEDPFKGTFEEYAAITAEFDTPRHMLDAPSRGWDGIAASCGMRAAHIINLHPDCQGAFSEILGRAAVARAHGIAVMVGGTGYPGVGSWPHAHLASVIGLDLPYGDICGARDHGYPESSALEMLPVVDGCFPVPDTPGHGGELNMDVVEKYTEWTLEIP